jgi:hypothetical protein
MFPLRKNGEKSSTPRRIKSSTPLRENERKKENARNITVLKGLIPPWIDSTVFSGGKTMRIVGRSLIVLAVAFVVVGLVGGQQPGGFGKGGFGGGGGPQDAVTLLRNEQVKKELGITDEQVEKIPSAVMKALGGVLDSKQLTRLRQIELQQRGSQAFLDPQLQTELKITSEQVSSIKTILEDNRKELAEVMQEAKGGGFQGIQEKMTALRKEGLEKVQGVLTADQRRLYKDMLGSEFKLEMKGFGGGGKGGNKGKKKKDI